MEIKNEKLFNRMAVDPVNPPHDCGNPACLECRTRDAIPTEEGRKQFFDMQSRGIEPRNPDDYYLRLMRGKWCFDFLTSEYRNMYMAGEWNLKI